MWNMGQNETSFYFCMKQVLKQFQFQEKQKNYEKNTFFIPFQFPSKIVSLWRKLRMLILSIRTIVDLW
jgi:hypothetical protein